jgi:type II restriction enzyme
MAVNRDKPDLWKSDVAQSVDMYNKWFLEFAPEAFRTTRVKTTQDVEHALRRTDLLRTIQPAILRQWPEVLPTLRMSTCPPLAVDRLIGLSGAPANLVKTIENQKKVPDRMESTQLEGYLRKIGAVIERLTDPDIFVWLDREEPATDVEVVRAATIVADRLCGAVANPIIRNAQEQRQLAAIAEWLRARGYVQAPAAPGLKPYRQVHSAFI